VWTGCIWSRQGPVVGCEHGNKPSGFIKCGALTDKLSEYCLLRKDSAPWS
jgi:hypothetical protein